MGTILKQKSIKQKIIKAVIFLFILTFTGVIVSYSRGSLSEEEAMQVIQEHLTFPMPVPCQIKTDIKSYDQFTQGLLSLESEGYIRRNEQHDNTKYTPLYFPTDKAKSNIFKIFHDPYEKMYLFSGVICNYVIKGVEKIKLIEKRNLAYVTVILSCEPVEPYHSQLCVGDLCTECQKEEKEKVELRKYDKGWRPD